MKSYILLTGLLLNVFFARSQSVGIGTSAPNSKAALEIRSTSKGLLIPSMTSSQRASITSPPEGLMVYDTDQHLFYHHDGSVWRKVINSAYWNNATNRNFIYNTSDSIGIGTTVPTERLQVIGNIRSTNMEAQGNISAGNILSGAAVNSSGTLVVVGNSILNGNILTNGNTTARGSIDTEGPLTIDNPSATVQFDDEAVKKAFIQLSGDDLRMGTNSGNSTGDVIVRLDGNDRFKFDKNGRFSLLADATPTMYFNTGGVNKAYLQLQGDNLRIDAPANKVYLGDDMVVDDATGRVGIGTTAPAQKLHVAGNVQVDGKLTASFTGTANLVPVCYGKIAGNTGAIVSGTSNFTVGRANEGRYNIYCNQAGPASIIIVSGICDKYPATGTYEDGRLKVAVFDLDGDYRDCSFNFVVYNPG